MRLIILMRIKKLGRFWFVVIAKRRTATVCSSKDISTAFSWNCTRNHVKVFRSTVSKCFSCVFLCLLSLSTISKVFASFGVCVEIPIVTQTITLAVKLHYTKEKRWLWVFRFNMPFDLAAFLLNQATFFQHVKASACAVVLFSSILDLLTWIEQLDSLHDCRVGICCEKFEYPLLVWSQIMILQHWTPLAVNIN